MVFHTLLALKVWSATCSDDVTFLALSDFEPHLPPGIYLEVAASPCVSQLPFPTTLVTM